MTAGSEQILDELLRSQREGRAVTRVRRTPGAYSSSARIEDVEVVFEDGGSEWFVLKDLSPGALLEEAQRVKPLFLRDPRREIETYRQVLRPYDLGAPTMVGAAEDERQQRFVLLLEKMGGAPLWQVGEVEAWREAARWLAAMHVRLSAMARMLAGPARLIVYDDAYYRRWRERAVAKLAAGDGAADARGLLRAYDAVVPRLLAMPPTFIHGEFHASNILVEWTSTSVKVTPVDWEMAALAPGLMDLADLTAGKWTEPDRDSLTAAYCDALAARGAPAGPGFDRELDCCRLHRAVQWLSWSDDWTPPRDHAQDWFGEALRVCDRLERNVTT